MAPNHGTIIISHSVVMEISIGLCGEDAFESAVLKRSSVAAAVEHLHTLCQCLLPSPQTTSYFIAVFKVSKLSELYCNQHVLSPKHFTLTVLILKMGKVLNSEVSVCKHADWSKLSYKRGTSQAVRPFCEFVPIRRKPPRSWVKLQICTAPLVRRNYYQVY